MYINILNYDRKYKPNAPCVERWFRVPASTFGRQVSPVESIMTDRRGSRAHAQQMAKQCDCGQELFLFICVLRSYDDSPV